MGMIGNLIRVSQARLDEYLADSSLLESDIYTDGDPNPNLVDIDKTWDGILFLLTGSNSQDSSHPLARILFSGNLIDGKQDIGYGPAHYLSPEEVKELNDQISTITADDLRQKYDAAKMEEMGVYPNVWKRDEEMGFRYLSDYFGDIQQVFAKAAQNGEAIITFIN